MTKLNRRVLIAGAIVGVVAASTAFTLQSSVAASGKPTIGKWGFRPRRHGPFREAGRRLLPLRQRHLDEDDANPGRSYALGLVQHPGR